MASNTPSTRSDPYLPIEDYAAVGNMHTVALVGRNGSVDWLCLPDFDSASVFAAILDDQRGGRFRIAPKGARRGSQAYLEHTNVLETSFNTSSGKLVVTDFMPLRGSIDGKGEGGVREPMLYRLLHAEGGTVEVEVEWTPRLDYARSPTQVMRSGSGFLAWNGSDSLAVSGIGEGAEVVETELGPRILWRFELRPGEDRALAARWGPEDQDLSLDAVREALDDTVRSWRNWVHKDEATGERAWAGEYGEQAIRSELVLKMLSYSPTGAIVAAPTTSLPEHIGGVRNWDYRYAWIRDAALTAQALYALGHGEDGHAFIRWAERSAQEEGEQSWGLQIMYGLRGQLELEEKDLPNLEGYRRSSPVRIGNGAADQLQLDIYGELISPAYEVVRMGDKLEPEIRDFLPQVADQACRQWRKADYGLWEIRQEPTNFVYSKVMAWMALDRALKLARQGVIEGDTDSWSRSRDEVKEEVLERGYDPELGAFKQSYERSVLDASNLLLPLQEFLPVDDPRVQSTIDATLRELTVNGLVYRYKADDGISGEEGSFGLCTFWMVDVLALSGRLDEAHEIFDGMIGRANHVGLYAEQIDPSTGEFLGNFPQAFTHLGMINSALYIAYKEGRDTPVPAPIGSDEHRSED